MQKLECVDDMVDQILIHAALLDSILCINDTKCVLAMGKKEGGGIELAHYATNFEGHQEGESPSTLARKTGILRVT